MFAWQLQSCVVSLGWTQNDVSYISSVMTADNFVDAKVQRTYILDVDYALVSLWDK